MHLFPWPARARARGTGAPQGSTTMIHVRPFHDPATSTMTYLVDDPATRDAIVIAPVLDFDPLASQTSTESLERLEAVLRSEDLRLRYVLETHAHADHL